MEEEGQTSLKAVRLDIEKLVRLHSLAMSEFAWNRVVSRQLPFGVIGVFFFFSRKKRLIERYPSFLIIKINPPPLPRHFSPKSQLVSVWRRRGGRGGRGGSGVVRILSRNVLLMRFNTLLLKGLFPLRRRNSTMLQNVRES